LPWWRLGFAQWPVAARGSLLVVCVSLVALSLTSGFAQRFDLQTLQTLGWVRPIVGLMAVMGNAATLVATLIPPLWIYLILSVGTMLYLLLFGLGAFAYGHFSCLEFLLRSAVGGRRGPCSGTPRRGKARRFASAHRGRFVPRRLVGRRSVCRVGGAAGCR
jgi:hypothetical protein